MVEEELQATAEGKVVIYCNTVSRVKGLVDAGLFQCEAFYSDISDARKKEVLEDFKAGVVRVVVATSALGMGIDIPDIRLIIHTDEPRDLLDYAQESGRAGRDGLASRAVMVQGGDKSQDQLVRRYLDGGECRRTVMDEFLDGSFERMECQDGEEEECDLCRSRRGSGREITDEVEEVDREVEEDQRVDQQWQQQEWQQRQQQQQEREEQQLEQQQWQRWQQQQRRRRRRRQQEEHQRRRQQERQEKNRQEEQSAQQRELDRQEFQRQQQQQVGIRARQARQTQQVYADAELLQRKLQRWKGVCLVCKAAGREDQHSVSHCPTERGRQADGERREMQGRIRFERYSGCFRCGVPQAICNRWESNGGRQGWRQVYGSECQFFGVMIGTLYGIKYGYQRVWKRWLLRLEEVVGVVVAAVEDGDEEDKDRLLGYLGQVWRKDELESNNLAREFLWLIGRVESLIEEGVGK